MSLIKNLCFIFAGALMLFSLPAFAETNGLAIVQQQPAVNPIGTFQKQPPSQAQKPIGTFQKQSPIQAQKLIGTFKKQSPNQAQKPIGTFKTQPACTAPCNLGHPSNAMANHSQDNKARRTTNAKKPDAHAGAISVDCGSVGYLVAPHAGKEGEFNQFIQACADSKKAWEAYSQREMCQVNYEGNRPGFFRRADFFNCQNAYSYVETVKPYAQRLSEITRQRKQVQLNYSADNSGYAEKMRIAVENDQARLDAAQAFRSKLEKDSEEIKYLNQQNNQIIDSMNKTVYNLIEKDHQETWYSMNASNDSGRNLRNWFSKIYILDSFRPHGIHHQAMKIITVNDPPEVF